MKIDKPTWSNIRCDLLISLFLVITTLGVYGQVRNHEFVDFDDDLYVTENPHVRAGLTRESVIWAFSASHSANWHPLTWLSHMLDVELYGMNPGQHHMTNLLFHMINTLLLFFLLYRMTGRGKRQEARGPLAPRPSSPLASIWPSAFTAALFALHPLHVESVAQVAERKDVLSTFFFFLTLWSYDRYARSPNISRYLPIPLFLTLGLMAKPMLVTLPFVLLLLDYWPLNRNLKLETRNSKSTHHASRITHHASRITHHASRFTHHASRLTSHASRLTPHASRFTHHASRLTFLFLEKLPLLLLVAVSSVITFVVQQRGGAMGSFEAYPLNIRIANALVAYVRYLGKMICPWDLTFFYPYQRLPMWQPVVSGLLLAGISLLVVWHIRRRPWLAIGWLWYLGTLVPVIGLVQVGSQAMADRYSYIPLIGIFVMIAWGVPDLLAQWSKKPDFPSCTPCPTPGMGRGGKSLCIHLSRLRLCQNFILALRTARLSYLIVATVSAILLAILMGMTYIQAGYWRNSIALFEHAIDVTEKNVVAHTNLGLVLQKQGRMTEAIHHLSDAVRIRPNDAKAHNNLAIALMEQGRILEAISHYSQALASDPGLIKARINLGLVLEKQGKRDQAMHHFSEAARLNPDSTTAFNALGAALLKDGNADEAIIHLREALRINPKNSEAHSNLGVALFRKGNIEEALIHFRVALRINPDFRDTAENIKKVLSQRKK